MTQSDEVKRFQEAGLQLAQRQTKNVKTPLEPSDLAKKLVRAQNKIVSSDTTS